MMQLTEPFLDWRALIERLPDPLIIVDRAWRLRYLNDAAQRLAREAAAGTEGQLLGRDARDVLEDLLDPDLCTALQRALHEPGAVERDLTGPDGECVHVRAFSHEQELVVHFRVLEGRAPDAEVPTLTGAALSRLCRAQGTADVSRVLTAEGRAASGALATQLYLPDDQGQLALSAAHGDLNLAGTSLWPEELGESRAVRDAWRSGRTQFEPHQQRQGGGPVLAALPLTSGTRVLGVLLLILKAQGAFRAGQLEALELLTEQGALALDRAHLTETLAFVEQRYRSLIEATAQIVWSTPESGEFRTPQPQWSAFTGQGADEHLGWGWLNAVHPEDRERTLAAWSEALRTRRRYEVQHRLRDADGNWHDMAVRAVPICGADGEVREWVGIHTDISDLRGTQRALQALNVTLERRVEDRTRQLELMNSELEAFSHTVSHDLRAPLRHVQGFTALLRRATDGQLTDSAQKYLEFVEKGAGQMGHLIEVLLEFARTARRTPRHTTVNLAELAREVRASVTPDLVERRVEWRIHDLPDVQGDPELLRVVLGNLVSNAVKYTATRDVARIEIGSSVTAEETVVFVRDNGVGFDARYAERLFQPFQRLHHAEEFEGVGVGLATVHRIVARHGGRVWAEGEPGVGATMYFTLPTTPPDEARS